MRAKISDATAMAKGLEDENRSEGVAVRATMRMLNLEIFEPQRDMRRRSTWW
jgi:hypothetical protein